MGHPVPSTTRRPLHGNNNRKHNNDTCAGKGRFFRLQYLGYFVAIFCAVASMWASNLLSSTDSAKMTTTPDGRESSILGIDQKHQDKRSTGLEADRHNTYQTHEAVVVEAPATTTSTEAAVRTEGDEDAVEDDDKEEETALDGATASTADVGSSMAQKKRPNLLFIVCDQLRWDAIGAVQNLLPAYKEKLKIKTPNIDELAKNGVMFRNAYCASPSCAPSRACFKTGSSLQRASIKGNKMVKDSVWKIMPNVRSKVNELETYEQILADKLGYNVESYGKWHIPTKFFYSKQQPARRIINYTYFDFKEEVHKFSGAQSFKTLYQPQLNYLLQRDNIQIPYGPGQQKNPMSSKPYSPAMIDPRHNKPTNTPFTREAGYPGYLLSQSNVAGTDSLGREHTTTSLLAKMSLRALDRLIADSKTTTTPFCLSVHFNAPHPPMVATPSYLDYYLQNKGMIFTPPSLNHNLVNNAYQNANSRAKLLQAGLAYNEEPEIKELTAIYYAMVEEVDAWLGIYFNKLKNQGIDDNTLVIFTSDHGEMLGAHGLKGKGLLLEEAVKVPLIMSFPGKIRAGRVIGTPVSHIDLVATMLDYLGARGLDKSDGKTLRRFIARNYNQFYEERYAVAELDQRRPISPTRLSGRLGGAPNFSIRKGRWKLIMTKKRNSPVKDMLFDLKMDPYEQRNMIGSNGMKAQLYVIGKAEHLRTLLVEYMERMDGGVKGYYSNPRWNLGEGQGDIEEIKYRQTWRRVSFWISDNVLSFAPAIKGVDDFCRRSEYLYIGRRTTGQLRAMSISVEGQHKGFFSVTPTSGLVKQGGHTRIKVTYKRKLKCSVKGLQAQVVIRNNINGVKRIPIVGE